MKAGNLDRRVTVQRQGEAFDDGYTTQPGTPTDYCTRWASWKPANGRETFESQGNEAKAGGTFWLRWDSLTSAILPTDVVLFQGRAWDIKGVQEIGRREGVELIVVAGD
ncbi:head-tail adaptor protein [Novosphingobium fluoreni]|uniref:head-tail adaptor protein n=1 Tax=Novosphingobium fluoreni TaxID=1391222 RepID=UPI003DA06C27